MTLSLIHRTRPATSGPAPHPALLLLHGRGSRELDLLALAPQIDPHVYVISARAPHRQGPGFEWYRMEEGASLDAPSLQRSLGLVTGFLDEIVTEYPIDPARLYVGGFSQGAAVSGALALTVPQKIAGAIMISGYLPPDTTGTYRPMTGFPIFQGHGTIDTIVPIMYARMTRDALQSMGIDLTYREYPIDHQVNLPELVDLATWLGRQLDVPARGR